VRRFLVLSVSHLAGIAFGFVLGIYMLPILTAPPGPSPTDVERAVATAQYIGYFHPDLAGSDLLHWGEGQVLVSADAVVLFGQIAPGPDYRLYLSPEFVEDEEGFLAIKDRAVQVGDVRTFENFMVSVPASLDISSYNTVVVWCESFAQFITAAEYRPGG
jgi:hypothetical protein